MNVTGELGTNFFCLDCLSDMKQLNGFMGTPCVSCLEMQLISFPPKATER